MPFTHSYKALSKANKEWGSLLFCFTIIVRSLNNSLYATCSEDNPVCGISPTNYFFPSNKKKQSSFELRLCWHPKNVYSSLITSSKENLPPKTPDELINKTYQNIHIIRLWFDKWKQHQGIFNQVSFTVFGQEDGVNVSVILWRILHDEQFVFA